MYWPILQSDLRNLNGLLSLLHKEESIKHLKKQVHQSVQTSNRPALSRRLAASQLPLATTTIPRNGNMGAREISELKGFRNPCGGFPSLANDWMPLFSLGSLRGILHEETARLRDLVRGMGKNKHGVSGCMKGG